ncbi:MAG TPA: hypothetical protein VGE16_12995 [Albitalea sp.]
MPATPRSNFFSRRWRGEIALPVLLWRDMLGVGTVVNLSATLAALGLVSQGVPMPLAVALHLATLPYNLFLLASLWRLPRRSALSAGIGLAWAALMTVV